MDVQGDSPLLRSHGAVLRTAAEDVGRVADLLAQRLEELRYRGPAADRFRAQMEVRTSRLRRASQQLDDVAQTVTQSGEGFPTGI